MEEQGDNFDLFMRLARRQRALMRREQRMRCAGNHSNKLARVTRLCDWVTSRMRAITPPQPPLTPEEQDQMLQWLMEPPAAQVMNTKKR